MLNRNTIVAIAALFFCFQGEAGIVSSPQGAAPNVGNQTGHWGSGIKQAFGTAYESYDSKNQYSGSSPTAPISKVWFTAGSGVLTEVYWPTNDTAQIQDSQFIVTDGASFFFDERKNSTTQVQWMASGVPAYRITNRDSGGKLQIERVIYTDPDRDVLIQRVRITRNVPGLQVYLLHNPSAGNTPKGDSSWVNLQPGGEQSMTAWQDNQAQALLTSVPWRQVTSGFAGTPSDGWQDLKKDAKLNSSFQSANNGNVVQTAWLDLPDTAGVVNFDIVIGFAATGPQAQQIAKQSLKSELNGILSKFTTQWQQYQGTIRNLTSGSTDGGWLFRSSVGILKSMEDKTYEGAFVASPTVPWGETTQDNHATSLSQRSGDNITGGYHRIWPRDLYQMATSFMSLDDYRSAIACLNYLRAIQLGPQHGSWSIGARSRSKDGSYPQNTWSNGQQSWGALQMDQVAMPVVLAYRLWKLGKIDYRSYWNMVARAADFMAKVGPWTQQERWEENFGASPSTIAVEIAALWNAAEMADQAGDANRAKTYRAAADNWAFKPGDNVDTWTFTTSGSHGNGRYFTRIEGARELNQTWNADDNQTYTIANGGPTLREKDVLDGGFLELVRLGIRRATDPKILDTLPEYDQTLGVTIPRRGVVYRRYIGDRYNYDHRTGKPTAGMPWPLLTGERGHYELARALETGANPDQAITPFIRSMELFATPSYMIPEQVWQSGPEAGFSTGAATPLGWAHGEYLKLLRSRMDRKVFDQSPSVMLRARMLEQSKTAPQRPGTRR